MKKPLAVTPLFDVIVIHGATGSIKVLAADKSRRNAEALAERGAINSKLDAVTYAVVPAGSVVAEGQFPWRSAWSPRKKPEGMLVRSLEPDVHGQLNHEAD